MTQPDLRVDVVVLSLTAGDHRRLRVLLADAGADGDLDEGLGGSSGEQTARGQRHHLPGDRLRADEGLDQAARRVLDGVGLEEPTHLEQLASFGDPDRVAAVRTVSVTYLALVPEPFPARATTAWHEPDRELSLAWDHADILSAAIDRVRSKLSYSTIAMGFLPREFTMSELQDVYEAVLGTTLDKRNFRKKVRGLGVVVETGGQRRGPHRPAALYAFVSDDLVLLDEVIASA